MSKSRVSSHAIMRFHTVGSPVTTFAAQPCLFSFTLAILAFLGAPHRARVAWKSSTPFFVSGHGVAVDQKNNEDHPVIFL